MYATPRNTVHPVGKTIKKYLTEVSSRSFSQRMKDSVDLAKYHATNNANRGLGVYPRVFTCHSAMDYGGQIAARSNRCFDSWTFREHKVRLELLLYYQKDLCSMNAIIL